jgi:hypothetical protein
MDANGMRVVVRDGVWSRESMPLGVVEHCERPGTR